MPPSQHPHSPERHPSRRLALPVVDLEPHPTCRASVELPAAVPKASGTQVLDRLAETRIGIIAGQDRAGAEIVERTQNVVAPAVRVQEVQEALVG